MYVCSCFGITEEQVEQHYADGRCTPRQIASACKAGTDCGSCVRRIQALLGRGAGRVTKERPAPVAPAAEPVRVVEPVRVAEPVVPVAAAGAEPAVRAA